ncbi:hypothetical protein [Streptomyces uncialis]|uniref:hypothetical protein n=1 Tax=Streptomyces uncialis TaxID=1048205 RepID=UPI003865A852|nr:hypothetical protein OG268_13370 [Streptomyces uncialis]
MEWLTADVIDGATAGEAAQQLAAENDADVIGFAPDEANGFPGYRVEIETRYTVGDSIIPGTESQPALAHATAVIAPRCDFSASADPDDVVELDCDGESVEVDPGDFRPGDLPDASVLFSVYLAE